jgi:HD-GYP domain-containing protein (c-di-GMP phosphodiesterase class II)
MGGIRRAELAAAFALATDLAIGQPLGFSLRAGILAVRLADAIGVDEATRRDVYWLSILHRTGCNAETWDLGRLVGDEIEFNRRALKIDPTNPADLLPLLSRMISSATRGRPAIERVGLLLKGLADAKGVASRTLGAHCEVAQRFAVRMGASPEVVAALGMTNERWNGKGLPDGVAGTAIPRPARIVVPAEDAMALVAVLPLDAAQETIRKRAGNAYDPEVAEALASGIEGLTAGLDVLDPWHCVLDLEPEPRAELTDDEFDAGLTAMADFADLKLPALAGHSRRVADLAAEAARRCNLPEVEVVLVHRAGLLHDLGLAATPSVRLAAGPGSPPEEMRLHPYYGQRIVARSAVLAPAGALIAEHHERLDGTGYHAGRRQSELGLASRLLAAAERYVELTAGGSPAVAAIGLRAEARGGQLDTTSVEAVLTAAGQARRSAPTTTIAGLTSREIEVLRLVSRGRSIKEVARELGIAPKTADNHIQNLYSKIGVRTRASATLFAVENGLIGPEHRADPD